MADTEISADTDTEISAETDTETDNFRSLVVEVGVENPRTGSTYDVSNACVLSIYCISINNLF